LKWFGMVLIVIGIIGVIETIPEKIEPVVEIQKIMVPVDLDACSFIDVCSEDWNNCNIELTKIELNDCFKSILIIRKEQ